MIHDVGVISWEGWKSRTAHTNREEGTCHFPELWICPGIQRYPIQDDERDDMDRKGCVDVPRAIRKSETSNFDTREAKVVTLRPGTG